MSDRDLVALHLERIVLRPRTIDMTLRSSASQAAHEREHPHGPDEHEATQRQHASDGDKIVLASRTIRVPWLPTMAQARKGIAWQPSSKASLDPATRNTLLTAIAKARLWISDLVEGRAATFGEIAEREGKVERHIRFLAPLAFLSPRIIEAIAHGEAAADLTVTTLARALPQAWAEQQRKLGIA